MNQNSNIFFNFTDGSHKCRITTLDDLQEAVEYFVKQESNDNFVGLYVSFTETKADNAEKHQFQGNADAREHSPGENSNQNIDLNSEESEIENSDTDEQEDEPPVKSATILPTKTASIDSSNTEQTRTDLYPRLSKLSLFERHARDRDPTDIPEQSKQPCIQPISKCKSAEPIEVNLTICSKHKTSGKQCKRSRKHHKSKTVDTVRLLKEMGYKQDSKVIKKVVKECDGDIESVMDRLNSIKT